jgi:hypothetical protein
MSSYGVPLSKRTAPVATLSKTTYLIGTAAVTVSDADDAAISGCLLHGIYIESATSCSADIQMLVKDAGTTTITLLATDEANKLKQYAYPFPAPLAIAGALTMALSASTNSLDVRVAYTPY